MMTEREALIAAVIQHPDDDTPRLIFADWCEENGEPERAAFVRVQCEIARMSLQDKFASIPGQVLVRLSGGDVVPAFGNEQVRGNTVVGFQTKEVKTERFSRLYTEQRLAWSLVGTRDAHAIGVPLFPLDWYDRGFLNQVTLGWTTFRDHADTLTASHPIREVTLTTMPQYVASQGRYVMHIYDPKGREDATLREMIFSTTNGYEELCRVFKDWLKSHWKRIAFNLPSLPGSRISFENPLL